MTGPIPGLMTGPIPGPMTGPMTGLTLRSIGEQGLLQRLQRFCPPGMIGDDAAVIPFGIPSVIPTALPQAFPTAIDPQLVITTDVLIDGVHFSIGDANPIVTTPPHSVGFRAAAANLSDLAAMGAEPIGITIGLGLPPESLVSSIEELYEGLSDALQGVPILGGDLVRSPVWSLSITAFGQVASDRVIRRSQGQVGDTLVMTGLHGRSRVGLALLLGELSETMALNPELKADCIRAHQYPRPRLDLLPHLPPTRIAGMDSSDGLADAVIQICRSSGVGAQLRRSAILDHPDLQALAQTIGQAQTEQWVLYGGEDFELILSLEPDAAQQFCQTTGSIAIGTLTEAPGVWLDDIRLDLSQGFQHF